MKQRPLDTFMYKLLFENKIVTYPHNICWIGLNRKNLLKQKMEIKHYSILGTYTTLHSID